MNYDKTETINALFERQAAETPDNIALVCGGRQVTYREMNEEANRRAYYLISRHVAEENFVAVVMDHSPEMIINLFAIMKSGAAYIAVEPTFPRERINYIMEQAGVKFVFSQRKYQNIFHRHDNLIYEDERYDSFPAHNTVNVNDGANAIYVLYTSGTTGTPKGVVVEQRNVCNYVTAFCREFRITAGDRMLQNSVCTFDIFTEEVYPILLVGGTLVIATEEDRSSVERLVDLIERERVTIISGFPYLLSDINNYRLPDGLRIAISGGDVLRKEHVSNLLGKVPIYNTYGPTETTVCASYYRYDTDSSDSKSVPIGTPVHGTEIYILDENLHQVAPGKTGQICISGRGVTRGYLNDAEETRKHFVENPLRPGERMYLSGDLGFLNADGNIEFVRRKDEQVMIGGRRVEPLEVESIVHKYQGIENAVIISRLDSEGYPYLLAYYYSRTDIKLNELKQYLGRYLPEFMIPEYFVKLAYLPKTESGKIDRRHLPIVLK